MDAVAGADGALAVARVNRAGGGTAFAVTSRLALTAFHVIGNRLTGEVRERTVELSFGGWTVGADIDLRLAPGDDVALLRLARPLPAGAIPVPLSGAASAGRWFARGFPVSDPSGAGRTIDGNVVDPDQRQPGTGVPVIALYCQQAAAGSPQPLAGFSGAPVLAAPAGPAIGVIRWNPNNPERPGIAEGGTVYACPVRSVLARWPELRDLASAGTPAEADTAAEPAEALHLRKLISQWERNLRTTELQASQYAPAELPLHLANRLESINEELRKLRERLAWT